MRRRDEVGTLRIIVLGAGLAMVSGAGPESTSRPTGPRVAVTSVEGVSLAGRVVAAAPELLLVDEGEETRVAWDDVAIIRPLESENGKAGAAGADEVSAGMMAWRFVDGSRLVLDGPTGGGEDSVRLEVADGVFREVAVDAVEEIRRGALSETAAGTVSEAEGVSSAADVVVVAGAARALRLQGTVQGMDEDGLRFAWNGVTRVLPWPRVAWVRFGTPLARSAPCRVVRVDGTVVAGQVVDGGAEQLELDGGVLGKVAVGWGDIAEVRCRSGRVVYLSEMSPRRYEFVPFFDQRWELARDETLLGEPIRLDGMRFQRGVCLHSRAGAVYSLNGKYQQFVATVGIDAALRPRGHAEVKVIADGRVLWQGMVRGDKPPEPIQVDVEGRQDLLLFVDFGPDLDLADHVCFGDARVIR